MSSNSAFQFMKVSNIICNNVAKIKHNENVLILSDVAVNQEISNSLYYNVLLSGGIPCILNIPTPEFPGSSLPLITNSAVKNADVIICATSKSVAHGKSIQDACKTSRVISIPGAKDEMFIDGGAATMNLSKLKNITELVANAISGGKDFVLQSSNGTNATFKTRDKPFGDSPSIIELCYGQCPVSGGPFGFGMFPDGEVSTAIYEDSLNGKIVIDGFMVGVGPLQQPIIFTCDNGKVSISGGAEAYRLQKLIDEHGDENSYYFGEFAIGTNPMARFIGSNGEDKKRLGTVHLALGDIWPLGELKSKLHLDGLIKEPTLSADGINLINEGVILFDFNT